MGVSVEEMENMLKPPLRQHLPGNKKGGKEGEFCGKAKDKPSPNHIKSPFLWDLVGIPIGGFLVYGH
jgi:hypothetical protein